MPKATTSRRSPLIFFIDRSCGRTIFPEALRAMGLDVLSHEEIFAPNELDVRILEQCGRRGWVYVSKDLSVRRNPAELHALNDARIHAVFLHGRRRPAEYLIENFRAGLGRIISRLEHATTPVHLVVTAGGRITIVKS
ncbi:MAG TPA: hypothetical protein VHT05_02625 [Candidatus Elarobacter sp.]|nr:hypothetical protein [Candidatus Elarobacter sp.]